MINYCNILKKTNLVWQLNFVNRNDRERLHKHRGILLWFTGLSGSGKSTLANSLEYSLHLRSISTYLMDGDNIRHGLCNDLGFSDADRHENIRRVGEVAHMMVDAGLVVLAAFISPFYSDRKMLRCMFSTNSFVEIFVDTPLSICQLRDAKGFYGRVSNGQLENFTGISSVYQKPDKPDIYLDGTLLIKNLTNKLLDFVLKKIIN